MPSIRIKLPDNKGEITHVLAGERITVGRRPDNTIQIVDRTVSAHHAEFIATNGHYRLHDLGATNLTCVDGQPITDFHLHSACKVSFGTIECEFNPETIKAAGEKAAEIVPTRAELEFLRRENLDLQSKIAAQQKQVDILSSARLMTKETTQLGVAPEAHRRVAAERDELREENGKLKRELDNLRAERMSMARDRDATRQAWETVKAELRAAQQEISKSRGVSAVATAEADEGPATLLAQGPEPVVGSVLPPEAYRAMGAVLTKAPALLDSFDRALEKALAAPTDSDARADLLVQSAALHDATQPVPGHPFQQLAASLYALLGDNGDTEGRSLRTAAQALELARALLDAKHLKRVKELELPWVLAIDDDRDLLATLTSALELVDMRVSVTAAPDDAIALLNHQPFDLVLLDIALPNDSGIALCGRIREIPQCKKVPIVFLTAGNTEDNRAQASLNGGSDFLSKPFNTRELTLKAQIWIYRYQFGIG